jgi:hypothetical protein
MYSTDKRRQLMICNFFPELQNKMLSSCLKFDDKLLCNVSSYAVTNDIISIINYHVAKHNTKPKNINIIDAISGVGCNSIIFGMNFNKVYSIEPNILRYNYLNNNISLYKLQNICAYNGNCTDIISLVVNYDVVYMDPMCTDDIYINKNKDNDDVTIKINNIKIENICKKIFSLSNHNLLFIALKLPINYNVKYLYDKLSKYNYEIKLHDIIKSYVVIITRKIN